MGKQSGLRRGLEDVFTLGAAELIPGSVKDRLGKKPGAPGKNLDAELAAFAGEILDSSRSTRQDYFSMLSEALQTGQAQNLIPEEQHAIEGALAQGSDETKALTTQLAKGGLVQTPYGQRALAQERVISGQRVGVAPADVINQLLLQAPAATIGQAQGIALNSQNQLANISQQVALARANAQAQAIGSAALGAGQIAGLGINAYTDYRAANPTAVAPRRYA